MTKGNTESGSLNQYDQLVPNLIGLVLNGGESSRMGTNKGLLEYTNGPEVLRLYNLLSVYCEKVFISERRHSKKIHQTNIEDIFDFKGPLNGIASALNQFPGNPFLIVPCDMPNIDGFLIQTLISSRDKSALFSGFRGSGIGGIEPLIGIWEPEILPALNEYIKSGDSARKFLLSQKINLIDVPNRNYLINVNTREDFNRFVKKKQ